MLTLLVILIVLGLGLAVLLFVGALFLQGYFYTQPADGLLWRAPAAAAGLTLFLFFWCWLIVRSPEATPQDIPYDTLFRFSPRVDVLKQQPKEIWAISRTGKKLYKLSRPEPNRFQYVDDRGKPWRKEGVTEIQIVDQGEKITFTVEPAQAGDFRYFVSDKGWVWREYEDGPTGLPSSFRWGRFSMNLILNVGFFVLLFLALWPLVRFQLAHALGLAVALWLVFTLGVLPMVLTTAAQAAQRAAG